MLQELGRIIAALVLLTARAIGRAYQGLRYGVRRARQTRGQSASAVPRRGRLLDIAVLSLAADLFVGVEWWRRDTGPVAVAALIGLGAGVVGAVAIGVLLRGPAVQYALAGTEALRLAAVFAFAFAAPTAVTGGTSDPALGRTGLAAVIALALVERALWTVAAGGRVDDALRYIGFLLPSILLLGLVALFVGGIFALVLAQLALFAAMCLAFIVSAPPPRPPKPPRTPKPPRPPKQAPAPRPPQQAPTPRPDPAEPAESAESAEQDGSYHLYRPNSLSTGPDRPERPEPKP